MNKTIGVVVGIIAIVLVAWLIMSPSKSPTTTPSQTSTQPTNSGQPTTTTSAPQAGMPTVVTNQKAFPTDTTVVVTGNVTPNGAFTSYWYEYGGTPQNMESKTPKQVLGSGFMVIPAPSYITGLQKNTTYYFRLNAENQYGAVSNGQYSFVTTSGLSAPVGTTPTTKTLPASGVSRTTANLNGEVTPNQAETQYWFEYGSTANLGNTTAFVSAKNGTAKVGAFVSIAGLDPLTTYYFRLNAQNQFGTINGTILTFKTNGPAAPAAPSVTTRDVTGLGTSTVTLRGTVNPNGIDTSYWFEYSTDSLFADSSLNNTEHTSAGNGTDPVTISTSISALLQKTTYYVRTVAQNASGVTRGSDVKFKTK